MKRLTDILPSEQILELTGKEGSGIRNLSFDSRKTGPGDLFFAVRGSNADGHSFIGSAVERGAKAIVCEVFPRTPDPEVTWIRVKDSSVCLGESASLFFGQPSSKLKLIGVTGTNGKTTTVTLLHELFMELGFNSGLLSTIRNYVGMDEYPATHTTPDPLQLNSLLHRMVTAGCEYCFMEVSSHAVDQNRIAGLSFKGGIFTNLTQDHLDYHQSFEAYLKAKKRFFDQLPAGSFSLVNKDDRNGMVMIQNCQAAKFTYSLCSLADFRCKILENQLSGLLLNIGGHEVLFRLIGKFNAYNLLAAYSCALLLGLDPEQVLTGISGLSSADGRFNHFSGPRNITAIVDYAHTPDALKNVLETINDIRSHRENLITLTGAGGNRDRGKRPLMARIACDLSDRLILTSDNPRNEDPREILEEMKKGIDQNLMKKVLIIPDRKEAIKTAVALAQQNDIILIAGKGHETYQEISGIRYPFDDREVVKEIFQAEEEKQT